MDFYKGEIILINKPLGWTSFDVVNKIRYIISHSVPAAEGAGRIKVGHAGTLDPLATGLLIICTGKLTKQIEKFQSLEKEYTGTFQLGITTPSFDLETKPDKEFQVSHITQEMILQSASEFTGRQIQVPPVHSAKKISGQRAYRKARKGAELKLEPAEIVIHEFEIVKTEMPVVHFRIVCSKGTYIRSVANDFGKALGSGACLTSLCRTKIGTHLLTNAMTIEEFEKSVPGLTPSEKPDLFTA